jgi:hypothetical protein
MRYVFILHVIHPACVRLLLRSSLDVNSNHHLITYDPGIMTRTYPSDITGTKFFSSTVVHTYGKTTLNYRPYDMLKRAGPLLQSRAYWPGSAVRRFTSKCPTRTVSIVIFGNFVTSSGLAKLFLSNSVISSPLSSQALRSAPLQRQSIPSMRMRSATWRLRRGLPNR